MNYIFSTICTNSYKDLDMGLALGNNLGMWNGHTQLLETRTTKQYINYGKEFNSTLLHINHRVCNIKQFLNSPFSHAIKKYCIHCTDMGTE